MFTDGFKKTASAPKPSLVGEAAHLVGRGAGVVARFAGKETKAVGKTLKESGKGFKQGFRGVSPSGHAKPERGSALAKVQARKISKGKELKHGPSSEKVKPFSPQTRKSMLTRGAKEKMEKRKEGIRSAARGPSWAMRHPLLTAGAGVVAGKAIFGEKKENPEPKILYPQAPY